MRFILLGIKRDQARLTALAQQISRFGHRAEHQTFSAKNTSESVFPSGATSAERVLLYCWTENSVSKSGAALQVHAIAAKEAGHYRGLICDDVAVPEAVRDAIDFRLKALQASDNEGPIKDLIRQLETAFAKTSWSDFSLRRISEQLRQLIGLEKKGHKLLFWLIGIVLSATAGTIGFSSAGLDLLDRFNLQPTAEQEAQWRRIEPLSNCNNFEDYLKQHGAKAPYADDAQLRLNLAKNTSGKKRIEVTRMPVSVSWSPRPFTSIEAARSDLLDRAGVEGANLCSTLESVLGSSAEPPKFEANQSPECANSGGGYRCKLRGVVSCSNSVADEKRVCSN